MSFDENVPSEDQAHRWRPAGATGVVAVIVAACAIAGVLAAAGWLAIAPRPEYLLDGQRHAVLADVEASTLMTADGWFAVITAAVCFVLAAVAYPLFGRTRPVAALIGLAVGGVVCSLVTWLLARTWWVGGFHHAVSTGRVGERVPGYLTVHAHGALLLGALFAVAAFGLIEALGGATRAPGGRAPDSGTLSPHGRGGPGGTGDRQDGQVGPFGPVAPSGPDTSR